MLSPGYVVTSHVCHGVSDPLKWRRWRLQSPAPPLFTQPFIQAQIIENVKAPRHWPLNSPVTGEFPAQMDSNAEMFLIDDVIMTGIITIGRQAVPIFLWINYNDYKYIFYIDTYNFLYWVKYSYNSYKIRKRKKYSIYFEHIYSSLISFEQYMPVAAILWICLLTPAAHSGINFVTIQLNELPDLFYSSTLNCAFRCWVSALSITKTN